MPVRSRYRVQSVEGMAGAIYNGFFVRAHNGKPSGT
nr:MAG TPA: hypothetical protein [Caudoviricetes sp.]